MKEILDWYVKPWKKFATFTGRAQRKEYWIFVAGNLAIGFLLGLIEGILNIAPDVDQSVLGTIFSVAALIPGIAAAVRRLHDVSKSGWWVLIGFIPLVGAIVLIVFMVQDSHAGTNAYGANPKEGGEAAPAVEADNSEPQA